jgi:pyridoxal phosphate enzyme (YggS family)
MTVIDYNLQAVRRAIADAAGKARRPAEDITLLAVSKSFPASAIREACAAGQTLFGESYLQEALCKKNALSDLSLEWHFIGPIQSNKSAAIAEHFSWVHGVDRFKIAERLSGQRPPHMPPLNVCLQVNIGGEPTKGGVHPDELEELARAVAGLPSLKLRGLMVIPPPAAGLDAQRKPFAELRGRLQQLNQSGLGLDTLSMGMSNDLEAAVLEGASIVRIGTAIFGGRTQHNAMAAFEM